MKQLSCILPLTEVGINDVEIAGGKNASLGEMLQHLSPLGINIPDGFVITVNAYRKFLEVNQLDKAIYDYIKGIDFENLESLRRGGLQIRQLIRNSRFPHIFYQQMPAELRAVSLRQFISTLGYARSSRLISLPG